MHQRRIPPTAALSFATLTTASLLACQPAALAASTVHWQHLRSVRVTVSAPSLPPPGGNPRSTSFVAGHGLARAQKALNDNDIVRLASSRQPSPGCAGGYAVAIKIIRQNSSTVKMTGTRCGGRTAGHIGGNLPGFLRSVGIKAP